MSAGGGAGQREVAYRVFAAEYGDADLEHTESDEERAPNYVITPTGARVNRLFVVGVLTEVESVSEGVLRARVVDPTGAFVCYAGQYQPDEQAFLERADPPTFVALTGKARTFSPEDSDRVFTSVRPEAINEADAETRDRWTVQAAEQTLERVRTMAGALALDHRGDDLTDLLAANDVEAGLAAGIPLALAHYGTTPAYLAALADVAIEATRLVAGEIDEVEATTVQPAATGEATLPVSAREVSVPEEATAPPTDDAEPGPATSPASGEAEPTAGEPTATDSPASSDESAGDPATDDPADRAEAASAPEPAEGEADATGVPAEPAADVAADSGGEPSDGDDGADTAVAEGPGAFEPGEFDLDDDERAEVEDEFGTEFQPGSEVDDPGAADIATPGPEDGLDPETADAATPEDGDSSDADDATTPDHDTTDAGVDTTEGTATDLEDAVVDAMNALDEGDGAVRSAVIERVVDRTGAGEAAVEDAIQDALMDGRCFEPADDRLQAI